MVKKEPLKFNPSYDTSSKLFMAVLIILSLLIGVVVYGWFGFSQSVASVLIFFGVAIYVRKHPSSHLYGVVVFDSEIKINRSVRSDSSRQNKYGLTFDVGVISGKSQRGKRLMFYYFTKQNIKKIELVKTDNLKKVAYFAKYYALDLKKLVKIEFVKPLVPSQEDGCPLFFEKWFVPLNEMYISLERPEEFIAAVKGKYIKPDEEEE